MVCFFLSLLKQKLPQRCPKQGGGGQGHFWTMSEREQLFFLDYFPQLINYEAVYRTAPATPGLLIIVMVFT